MEEVRKRIHRGTLGLEVLVCTRDFYMPARVSVCTCLRFLALSIAKA